MAVISNIKKYTINGEEIPEYPVKIKPSDNLISKTWNDIYGTVRDLPIALKLKIPWIFDMISDADLTKLYGQMIRQKIIETNSRFFEINTRAPGIGWVKGTFYLGAPTNFESVYGGGDDGDIDWWSCELHWIEVDGIKLLDPTKAIVNGVPKTITDESIMKLGNNFTISDILKGEG